MIASGGDNGPAETEPKIVVRDRRRGAPGGGSIRPPVDVEVAPPGGTTKPTESAAGVPFGAGGDELRQQLEERTADLQRITAEYANHRKRVERDRARMAEQATAVVLTALLPVLDDIERAREHGDLTGGFETVAEHLLATVAKLGLTSFGEPGDPFDPSWHEAVSHAGSANVAEPTCVQVLRKGYALGERLLRPALVIVADPGDESDTDIESTTSDDAESSTVSTDSVPIDDPAEQRG